MKINISKIFEEFENAIIIDMESASAAYIVYNFNIPFIIAI
ncbi:MULTISPECIES: hypothetical protein [Borreliella]|nr:MULTISPECIES: hypothetical protein [Borreliella]ACN55762.1 pfs protein [Borreliella burgdorferi WI91-23]